MNLKQNRLPRLFAFLFLAIVSLTKMGCQKADLITPEEANQTEKEEILANATDLNEQVKRVQTDFKRRGYNSDFAKSFSKKYGTPLWDKSIVIPRSKKVREGKGNSINDTTVIIPILEPNANKVQTYIEATISDSVQLSVYTANRYKSLPFSNGNKVINEAEKIAIRFMILNKAVFNHSSFNITDKRLFHGSIDYSDTALIKRKIILKEKAAVNSAKMMYVEVCAEVVTTIQHCPYPGRCTGGDGACDGCDAECTTIHSSIICDGWWEDTGGGGGGWSDGGGGTGGGSGSGGGGGTGDEPCTGSGPIVSKVMPCGDTGGGGWEPVDETPVYSDVVSYLMTALDLNPTQANWLQQNQAIASDIEAAFSEDNSVESKYAALMTIDMGMTHNVSTLTARQYYLIFSSYVENTSATYTPQYWLYFSIQYAILKAEHPDWNWWELAYEASEEMIHLSLDIGGLVPVVGEIADLANGVLYTLEGDGINASLSYAAAIPIVGWSATTAKFAKKAIVALDGSKRTLKWMKKTDGLIDFGDRRLLRKVMGLASGDLRQAHHIIPWEHGTDDLVQKAAQGNNAFHLNELLNGIPLTTIQHNGSHNLYNSKVKAKLIQLWQLNGGVSMSTSRAEQLVRGLANQIRTWVTNHPNSSINDIIL